MTKGEFLSKRLLGVAFRARADAEALDKPQSVSIRIVDVQLSRPPALIDGALVNLPGSVRIPRRLEPSRAEPAKHSINIVGHYDDRLSESAVPAMA